MERFHVSATGHSLNYLPEYIAQRHGLFAEQGLDVSVTVPSPWDLVLEELADTTASAALGGIWVPSMFRNRGKSYTAFAQVANRCPLALLKRGSAAGFELSEAVGRTVLMKSGNGASVGLFFKMLLRESGINPNAVHFVQDLDGKMLAKLFEGGMGDYFVVDNVTARIMARKNPAISIAMEMVQDGDEIPWSVYYRETDTITAAVIDKQTRFCAALGKAMDWVNAHDAKTYQDELAALFPAVPVDILVDLTNKYRKDHMWSSPVVSRRGYARWQKGLADGRLIGRTLDYEDIVDDVPSEMAAGKSAMSLAVKQPQVTETEVQKVPIIA